MRLEPGAVLVAALVASVATAEPAPKPPSADPLPCAKVTANARNYGYGYQHSVTLSNQCQRTVSCEVWTNVDPTPHLTVSAKPGESATVFTRLSSPSREVEAGKSCRLVP